MGKLQGEALCAACIPADGHRLTHATAKDTLAIVYPSPWVKWKAPSSQNAMDYIQTSLKYT